MLDMMNIILLWQDHCQMLGLVYWPWRSCLCQGHLWWDHFQLCGAKGCWIWPLYIWAIQPWLAICPPAGVLYRIWPGQTLGILALGRVCQAPGASFVGGSEGLCSSRRLLTSLGMWAFCVRNNGRHIGMSSDDSHSSAKMNATVKEGIPRWLCPWLQPV